MGKGGFMSAQYGKYMREFSGNVPYLAQKKPLHVILSSYAILCSLVN